MPACSHREGFQKTKPKPWYVYRIRISLYVYVETTKRHISLLQEASFKEFISRPENRHLVEKHQKREVKQAIQLQEKMAALKFRDVVLESEYDAQIAIAPFLKNKVLRRIVQTFANDERGNFEKWATNPRIINMLSEFQKLINQGKLSEDEAEEYMLRVLKDPSNEYHEEFETKTRQVARLPTEQLVEALNEHVRI